MSKCHYTTLGVSKTATLEEIKAAFRKLSMETHPDVADGGAITSNVEAFKRISEAHSVLSNSVKRSLYDRQLQESTMWGPHRGGGGGGFGSNSHNDPYGGRGFQRPNSRQPGSGGGPSVSMGMRYLLHPRYMMWMGLGFCSVVMLGASTLGGSSNHSDDHKRFSSSSSSTTEMVEAWKNPATGKWEQPTPWDAEYRRLKPTLQLVPKHQVQRKNIR
jgi:curved DNA-binding protein CbpA